MLPDEKCLSCKTEVYLLLSMFSENCLRSDLHDFVLRPYAATERKPNVNLEELIRCCPFTQGHSGVFRFQVGSLYFTVCKNRYTHSPIIPQYSVGSSALKKAKATVLCSNFLSNKSGILPILPSSESLRLDLSFLKVLNRRSS